MKKMSTHMAICLVLVGVGALLLVAGVAGGWVPLLLLGCMAMMGVMMWMMGGTGGGDNRK